MVLTDQKGTKNNRVGVILIDDDPAIGCLVKGYTNKFSCATFLGQAYRGMMGVEMVQESLPSLVIIDLHVPGSSGFDLLTWIKETYPNIKIVIISKSVKPEYKMIAESLGADFFLDKQDEMHKISDIIYLLTKSEDCSEEEILTNK